MSDERAKIRQDIQTYETQKKIKRLAHVGTMAGLAGMGYGGGTGNNKLLGLATLGTMASAFGAGRAKKKRDMALGRIKRHYDLRDDKLFNMRAVLPTHEEFKKHGMVGGALEAITGLGGMPLSHMVELAAASAGLAAPYAAAAAHLSPFAIDVAATPGLAKWITNRGLDFAKVFAKQQIGKPLSPAELKMVGKAFKAKGHIASAAASKTPIIGPLRRYFTDFFSGPAGFGSTVGEHAGMVLKNVGEISPRYQDMGLEAINSAPARQVLLDVAKQDLATLNKGLEATKDTRAAKFLTRVGKGGAPSLKQLLSSVVERPQKLEEMVNQYKALENKTVRGLKSVGVGTGAAILANTLGQTRTRHPLSKDELPKQLATKTADSKVPAVKPRVDQAADANATAAQPAMLGQDASQMVSP